MCKGQYRGVWRERKGSANSEMREKENREILDSYGSRDEDGKKLMIGLKKGRPTLRVQAMACL